MDANVQEYEAAAEEARENSSLAFTGKKTTRLVVISSFQNIERFRLWRFEIDNLSELDGEQVRAKIAAPLAPEAWLK